VLAEAPMSLVSESLTERAALAQLRPPDEEHDVSYHFALGDRDRIQIIDDRASPDIRAVAVIPLNLEGFDRIEAVRRLLSALYRRAIPPDTRLTRQQRARLRRMLQAFDGHRDGATQQDIAQVIFNIGMLDRDDWQASFARHAVKALLRDARAMIAGGYRKLLRHRRQP
jgi:hypothetical protein